MLVAVWVGINFFSKKEVTAINDWFEVSSCNDYIELMRCVATNVNGDADSSAMVNDLIAERKKLSSDELQQQCSNSLETALSKEETYIQYGCRISSSASRQDVLENEWIQAEENANDDQDQEDLSIIKSISNEIDHSADVELSQSNNAYSEDREVVDNILELAAVSSLSQ